MTVFQKLWHFVIKIIKVFVLSGAAVLGMFTTIILTFLVIAAMSMGKAATPDIQEKFANEKVSFGKEYASNSFLAVDVNGVILGDRQGLDGLAAFLSEGVTYGYDVKEQLREAADKNDVDGVILMVDSPGGTIFGSQAIADGVEYYKQKTGKPVITYVGGMAASGGYWTAIAGDLIMADHGTAIGSIGVIFGPFKYYDEVISEDGGAFMGGVVTQGGIETTYITAGRSKDIGNPYRRLTPEETAQLQESVNDSYSEFVKHVANERKLPEDKIRNEIGAMLFGELQAQKLGLIDMIGSKEDAYAVLAERAGVAANSYKVIRQIPSDDFFGTLLSAYTQQNAAKTATTSVCSLNTQILAYHGNVLSLCP